MQKKISTLRETFATAVENYNKKNFILAESLCLKILSIDTNHFNSLVLLANISAINGNYKKAKEFLIQANETEPNNLSVLNNLGTACRELGNIKESISFYEKIIKINPKHTNAHYNLGVIHHNLKDLKKAKYYFIQAVELQPNYAIAFANLGNTYAELKDYENALSNYQKAIKINPKIVSAHNNLGLVYRALNDYQNATKCYDEVIKIKPNHAGAYHNLALALKEMGKFKKSIEAHEMAIKHEPENFMHYFYLNELKNDILNSSLKKKIDKTLKVKNLTKSNIAYGNYLLAKYEKKNNNLKKELDFLIKGHKFFFESRKEKFQLGVKYCFDDVIKISEGAKVTTLHKKDYDKVRPIFIIGVPRCGSTLVEKIIGSGSNIVPMGEETAVFENYINSKIMERESLNLGNVNDIRNELYKIYKEKGLLSEKYNNRFTDKSLNNFFYLEIILDIFPNAKIINCIRNPLSSIMSIFQNNITELAWAHDLNNIFKYFNNYNEAIENYKKVYPNVIFELEFEQLVNNPEEGTKKLMKYCELPWSKKCLEFYKRNDLISKTASNVQVRKAIYKHSAEKYASYKSLLSDYGKNYSWFN